MFHFLGKTHIPHEKHTAGMPAVRMPSPAEVLIPLSQHIGAPATALVKAGDAVKVGQKIAEAGGFVSSPIYAPISGTVGKDESVLISAGRKVPAIRIVSDGQMAVAETVTPPDIHDFDSFRRAVQESGLVGLGGAGFPTAVKLDAEKKGLLNTVVINGAECEPYITSDTRTMIDRAEDVKAGVELLMKHLSADRYVIGIEKNKPEAIAKMQETFADNDKFSVAVLPDTYPQGGEKILIYNTTGRVVPKGKLPADVGVLVINVTSLAFLGQYAKTGMPLVEKCVTVDGPAVADPKNVIVPIGTPIIDVLNFVGVEEGKIAKILYGGPMMGVSVYSAKDPVLKTTNALTVFDRKSVKNAETVACIHCGRCVEHCPMGLTPTLFTTFMEKDNKDERAKLLDAENINLCMECGCCSFVCPSKRPLVQNNRLAKAEVREYNARQATLKG